MKTFYRRRLPHYQPPHATFFVTFRLAGSLPKDVIERLKRERENIEKMLSKKLGTKDVKEKLRRIRALYFGKFDNLLDGAPGNRWLADPRVADIVSEAIQFRNGRDYDLMAYCVMSNHVHLVVSLARTSHSRDDLDTNKDGAPLYRIMQQLKSFTAIKANKLLGRSGAFWHHESYDHVVRDDAELERVIRYVLNNPVKAGLAADWQDWKWAYCKWLGDEGIPS